MSEQSQPTSKGSNSAMWITVLVVIIVVAGGAYYFLSQDSGTNITNNINSQVNATTNSNKNTNLVSNTNATNGLRTFSNSTLNIAFQYPQEWNTITFNDISNTTIVDLSHISSTLSNYDNLPVDEQLSQINCDYNYYQQCEHRVSTNGVKYVWIVEETPGGLEYRAVVPTGKLILSIDFQEQDNYDKKAAEYQQLLSSLRILEGGN